MPLDYKGNAYRERTYVSWPPPDLPVELSELERFIADHYRLLVRRK
jgi:hypothetical protein